MFYELARLPWPAIGEIGRLADAVAIIPTASTEQHGPHLPVFADSFLAASLAERTAKLLSVPVLVTPVVSVGLSDHHVTFPGTITLSYDTFAAVIQAHIEAVRRIGIRRIALFSGHGGNFRALGEIAAKYQTDALDCRIVAYSDLARFLSIMVESGKKAGIDAPETDVHAGALETSYALYIFPELVGPHSDVEGYSQAEPGWMERLLTEGMSSLSSVGVLGSPGLASAAAGKHVIEDLSTELARWFQRELIDPGDPVLTVQSGNGR